MTSLKNSNIIRQSTFRLVPIIKTTSVPQSGIIYSELNILAILANADPVTTIV